MGLTHTPPDMEFAFASYRTTFYGLNWGLREFDSTPLLESSLLGQDPGCWARVVGG